MRTYSRVPSRRPPRTVLSRRRDEVVHHVDGRGPASRRRGESPTPPRPIGIPPPASPVRGPQLTAGGAPGPAGAAANRPFGQFSSYRCGNSTRLASGWVRPLAHSALSMIGRCSILLLKRGPVDCVTNVAFQRQFWLRDPVPVIHGPGGLRRDYGE